MFSFDIEHICIYFTSEQKKKQKQKDRAQSMNGF